MNETTSETKPMKLVNRNVAIALGIMCIILIVTLAGIVVVFLVPDQNLQSRLNDATSNLNAVMSLQKKEVLLNNEPATQQNGYSANSQWDFSVGYAGYIYVFIDSQVDLPSNQTLWVEVSWFSYYLSYTFDQTQIIGNSAAERTFSGRIQGGANFPVLPSDHLLIKVGTNQGFNATESVTATLYY